ncbi:hypothetical protein [Flavobacterium sp.]|uniref:hypothetical protein n=1 Tax=Flavobacterium sp. TaxID=239 RepID=UPI0037515C95
MTEVVDDNIFGFYANFQIGELEKEIVKTYLWGNEGLHQQLKSMKWQTYGQDFHLILFEFYVRPIPYLREALKEMGSYRRKEKSIGIPIIIDQENFFNLNEIERFNFFHSTILKRFEMLKEKVKRNKLDLNIEKLIIDTGELMLRK